MKIINNNNKRLIQYILFNKLINFKCYKINNNIILLKITNQLKLNKIKMIKNQK